MSLFHPGLANYDRLLGLPPLPLRGVALVAGVLLVPVHAFYLKYFEERELEVRFGQSYLDYKRRVPFLIPGLLSPSKTAA